jgi:hypothetical protein
VAPTHITWAPVIARAAEIVNAEPERMTVRDLHRRLVGEGLLPPTEGAYSRLSGLLSSAKRAGTFPATRHPPARTETAYSVPPPKPEPCAAPYLAIRVRAVADANRRDDHEELACELDLLAEAARGWAAQVRERQAAIPDYQRNVCAF